MNECCVTDGEWSNWDSWSQCSVECGTGTRSRTRRCDSPEPSGGGEDCAGELEENENCNIHTCVGMYCLFVCLFVD